MIAKIPRGLKVRVADDGDIEQLHEGTQEPRDTVDESWNRFQDQ